MYEEEIKRRLVEMSGEGMTHSEIGRKLGIPISTVSNILSGYREIKNPSVDMLLKVFPNCRIDLDGKNYISTADHGGVSVQDVSISGNGNNFFGAASVAAICKKIADQVMASDIQAEAKVKVYSIISNAEKEAGNGSA